MFTLGRSTARWCFRHTYALMWYNCYMSHTVKNFYTVVSDTSCRQFIDGKKLPQDKLSNTRLHRPKQM